MSGNFTKHVTSISVSSSAAIALLALIVSCEPGTKKQNQPDEAFLQPMPPAGTDFFVDITKSSGINFLHSIGDDHLTNIVESVGGGAAWFDYDKDGFIDLYVANGSHHERLSDQEHKPDRELTNKLYRNKGNGTFEDVTEKAGVGDKGYGLGVSAGDYNNDGYPDLYLSNYGPNVLYKNNGNGTFTDVSKKAGISGDECSVSSVWVDYDNDGLLDLYVGNYLHFDPDYKFYYSPDGFPGPLSYDGESDRLYRNLGNDQFEDVTEATGVFNPNGRAMGVGTADYNEDGFIDIYVANDQMVNYLYRNEGGKKFTEVAIPTGTAFNQMGEGTISMAVDFADYNNDGYLDLWVSDDAYCSLYKNNGSGVFTEESYPSGIAVSAAQHVGWSSSFVDYDNDGDLDIFKTNGELKHLYGQEDQLFENNGDQTFTDVSTSRGPYFFEEHVGRGACLGDYDNDGDLDIFIVNLNDNGILLRNDHGNDKNWILINLIGSASNRDAYGAKVKVTASGKQQYTYKKNTVGYLSQNDPRIHVGLGDATIIDKIEVVWPSGTNTVLEQVKINQALTIEEK